MKYGFGFVCVIGIINNVTGNLIGHYFEAIRAEARFQATAVEHHAAEWRIDPQTGEKSFHWLTDKAESPTP